MDNMHLYNQFRETPKEARKPIQGGRLKGFTDINPMWRFKRLTEVFGPCGIGWKYEIVDQRILQGHGNEAAAFVDILLYYKVDGKWSEGIPGTGGSAFVTTEKNGFRTSDECFKMALTDAIGTACKALGMSADIFFEKGESRTKYTQDTQIDATKEDLFEKAKAIVLRDGPYTGEKLGDVWLKDIGHIKELRRNPDTPADIKAGIETMQAHIAAAR